MTAPTLSEIGTPLYEERLREAVAAGVVPMSEVHKHVSMISARALTETNMGQHKVAAQLHRFAADLCQTIARYWSTSKPAGADRCYWCDEEADLVLTKEREFTDEDGRGGVGLAVEVRDVPLCVSCYRDEMEGR